MMKRLLCIVLAISMIAAIGLTLAACGDDKDKDSSSKSDSTKAPTSAPTSIATTATASAGTTDPNAQATQPQGYDPSSQETQADATQNDLDGELYGGLTGNQAIQNALGYCGDGYQCVYYDKQYLLNDEAWYIGVMKSDGSDSTVYYMYVNANGVTPQSAFPDSDDDSDDYDDDSDGSDLYAGIPQQDAIFAALNQAGSGFRCVSTQQTEYNGNEYWLITVQNDSDPSSEFINYYVNAVSCFQG